MIDNSRLMFWFVLALVGAVLVYLLAPILTPFIAGALLAYLGDPLADRLEARKLSRTASVIVVFVLLLGGVLALLVLIVPVLESQLLDLIRKMPEWLGWLNAQLKPWLESHLGIKAVLPDPTELKSMLQSHLAGAGSLAKVALDTLGRSGALLFSWLANLFLIPVVTFYLLRDWDRLMAHLRELLPRRAEPIVTALARESDEVLAAFLRGQFLVMLALGAIYSIGLWLAGLQFALLIGMLAGLVSFVPYMGFIVGIVVAGLAMFLQTQEWLELWKVLLVFGIGQALEGTVLTPLLVGDRIGLHPVAVIFAVLAGGQLFGFFGVLLALPVAAVIAVLLRYLHRTYKHSGLYGSASPSKSEE
ncbi:MAG: AI-2E family transporter [Gammaproteobacteria bacterium]|jgi:predicted PurR-regulated permease PerM